MTINIKEQEIQLKYTFRSLMMFENITNSTFSPQGVTDIITLFYCVVICSNRNTDLTFDEFLDWLDDNQVEFKNFGVWLEKINTQNEALKKK